MGLKQWKNETQQKHRFKLYGLFMGSRHQSPTLTQMFGHFRNDDTIILSHIIKTAIRLCILRGQKVNPLLPFSEREVMPNEQS